MRCVFVIALGLWAALAPAIAAPSPKLDISSRGQAADWYRANRPMAR